MANPPGQQLEDDEGIGLPQEYIDFVIMRKMGWDYWTYHSQPSFFLDMIQAFIAAEAKSGRMKSGEK